MASANDSSKRRRLLGDASPPGIKCLSDLPNGVLTHAASYLDAPSRAFFAASLAINQDAAAASDERNAAIVDHEWSTLDFGDIEKDLVVRLIDGDISSILMCIDAANKLKTLKLTNCLHITGAGLEPLRGSTMIEQIDLSLVGKNKRPYLNPEPSISCAHVLPILDSIIEREGCSLRHLQFPFVWREGRNVQFDQFLRRYNSTLLNRGGISCLKCSEDLPQENANWIQLSGHHREGCQNYTCGECLKYYCEDCEDDEGENMLLYCESCDRNLCADCQSMKYCTECQENYCVDCKDFIECSVCSRCYRCKDCTPIDWSFCCKCERHYCGDDGNRCTYGNVTFICENDGCYMRCCNDCEEEYGWPSCSGRCEREFCHNCNEKKEGMDAIRTCKICDVSNCGRCRISMMEEEEEACNGCIEMAGRVLMEENKKLRKENKDSGAEIQKLKYEARQMENYTDYLNEQLKIERGRVKELWRRK